ncbi:MAG: hypothetical protein HY699_09725 [Deltaproteobacteria bacterium]|nr:hypothetical protein [Deltaproteobacteria bacterium]
MRLRRLLTRLTIVATLAGPAAAVRAGQPAALATLQQLVRAADTVVLAHCDSGESKWADAPPIIVTRRQCQVERAFKGSTGATLTLQTLGGRVGDVVMGSSALTASVPANVAVVLLLRRSQFGSHYVLAGGAGAAVALAYSAGQYTIHGMALEDFARWAGQ